MGMSNVAGLRDSLGYQALKETVDAQRCTKRGGPDSQAIELNFPMTIPRFSDESPMISLHPGGSQSCDTGKVESEGT